MENRILIVDDEKMIYSVLARRLSKEGYTCVMANNGREALGHFYKDNFSFKDKIPMIRNHHEHYDGSGYPDGLIGEVIPLESRIIAVSDAFDAMTSLRPHRRAMPIEDVLFEMERGKGR